MKLRPRTRTRSVCVCVFGCRYDARGNHVVYSCAGRAASKNVADNVRHMIVEMERIFDGNSAEGRMVWIVDFAGFGFARRLVFGRDSRFRSNPGSSASPSIPGC